MTRRELIAVATGIVAGSRTALADWTELSLRDYSKCAPNHLTALARSAYELRNREISSLQDPAAIARRQQWARETFWRLIGGEPRRTPLNARVTGKIERPGYVLEKIVFESSPRVAVSANLYIPTTGKPPYPGVLFQMGHGWAGKAASTYQKCCQGLARLGYLVLGFDPMGQGERIAYRDPSGTRPRLDSSDDEHTVPGKQLLLLGETASRWQTWDAIRALDYLESHPLVDRSRLASTGQSGGGTVTMMLSCVDPRLSAVAICSGNTENVAGADFNPPGSTDDAEQDFISSGPAGFDRWDLLYPIAPKPLLILVTTHDIVGTYSPQYLNDGRREYERLARIYEILGHRDRIRWSDTPLPHSLTYSLRLEIYNWFERWLKNSDRPIGKEPPVEPESETTLWAGAHGNVFRDFEAALPCERIRERAREVKQSPDNTDWARLLPVRLPPREARFTRISRVPGRGLHVEAADVRSAPEVWVPAWIFVPDEPAPQRPAVLVLDDRGRSALTGEDGLAYRSAGAGAITCVADIRGIGDMRPEVGRGNPGYMIAHGSEEDLAWASLILGDPLLAQRVEDILTLVQALRNDPLTGQRGITVAARGRLAVPALFAFAASRLIDSLSLSGGLVSYRNLLESEDYQQTLANFAWNLFSAVDLPQLAAQSAPRRVRLAGTVDAAGNRMPLDQVRAIYSSPNVAVTSDQDWEKLVLASL